MPVPVPCPQCGKSLKLVESMLGKSIRCPSCKMVFKAPPPTPADIPEVLAVTPVGVTERAEDDVPVLEEVRDDRPAARQAGRGGTGVVRAAKQSPRPAAPPRKRGGAVLILSILGGLFLLCAGFGTVAFFVVRGVINEINNPPIPEAEWQNSYRPGNGRCSVSIPGHAGFIYQTAAAGSQRNVQKFGSTLDRYHRKFIVAFIDMPPGQLPELGPDPLQGLARAEADNVRTMAGGKLVEERDLSWNGPAHEFVMELTDKRLLIERMVILRRDQNQGAMAYILAIEGQGLHTDSPEVARFFDSLQIDPPPPPPTNPKPQPDPNPQPWPKPDPSPKRDPNRLHLSGDRLTIHPGGTQRVCYSPDGKTLAAVGEDGVLTLVDMPALTPRTKLAGIINGPVVDMAYSKDGTLLGVAAREDVYLFEAATGKLEATLVYHNPVAVAFSPDARTVAVGVQPGGPQAGPVGRPRPPRGGGGRRGTPRDRDAFPPPVQEAKSSPGQIVFWSRKTRMQDGEPIAVPDGVRDVAWSPDGALLAAASGKQVHFYDPATRKERRTLGAHQGPITGLAFAPDGRSLVTAGGDMLVKLWSVPEGKVINSYEQHRNPAGRPVFSPDGSRLATFGGPGDEIVIIWETSGKPLGQMVIAPAQIQNVSFDRDGQTLAIAVKSSQVRIWNTRVLAMVDTTPRPLGTSTRPDEAVNLHLHTELRMVRFSPDGKILATSGRDGELMLLETKRWTQVAAKTSGKPNLTFAYSGDGRLLVAAAGGQVYLRDGATGGLRGDFPAGNGHVRSVAVSPDGKLVAVGFDSVEVGFAHQAPPNASSSVRLWDISDEPKELGTFEKLPFRMGAVAFSPDGKTLYAAAGLSVRRWQTQTREEQPALTGAVANLLSLAVAPDGHVYAAGEDRLIHSWDKEGRPVALWEGHALAIRGLSLTADGRRLASVADDQTCRVWDTATGETTALTEDRSRVINPMNATGAPAFSPDSSLLAVGSDYGSLSVLRTSRLKLKEPPRQTQLPLPTKKASSEKAAVAAFSAQANYFRDPLFSSNDTLLAANANGPVLRWSWPAGTLRDERHHVMTVSTMERSQDGKVVALKAGMAIYFRDGASGKLLSCVQPEFPQTDNWVSLWHVTLSPKGDLCAGDFALRNKHELIVWDVREGRQRVRAKAPHSPSCLAFSPDGKKLATCEYFDSSYRIVFYDPLTLKPEAGNIKVKDYGRELAFSPDGKRLAVGDGRGMVAVLDLDGGKEVWARGLGQANVQVLTLCYSPDGKWLLAGPSPQKGLVLVDAATGELRAPVTRQATVNSRASFSPDGKFLAVVQRGYAELVVYDVEKLLAARP